MAKSIMDAIRGAVTAPQQDVQGATEKAITTRTTGKVAPTGGVQRSSLGQQMAQQTSQEQTNLAAQQVAQEEAMRAEQAGAVKEQGTAMRQQARGQQEDITQNMALQTQAILDDLEAREGELDLQRDSAAVEQIGVLTRLSNNKYIQKLQDEGRRERLTDSANFAEKMREAAYGENTVSLMQKLGFNRMIDANDRQFNEALSNMDAEAALALATAMAQDAAISGGLKATTKIATSAVDKYQKGNP